MKVYTFQDYWHYWLDIDMMKIHYTAKVGSTGVFEGSLRVNDDDWYSLPDEYRDWLPER